MKKYLLVSCIILIILALFFIISPFTFLSNKIWAKDIFFNIAAEIIGILLVVFLIDQLIDMHNERERKKRENIAYQQLRITIYNHFLCFFDMFKASVIEKPDKDYKNAHELFDNFYYEQIAYLNLLNTAPVFTKGALSINWYSYLSIEFRNFKEALNRTLMVYSLYLPSQVLTLIEEIINSNFLSFIVKIDEIQKMHKKIILHKNLFSLYNFRKVIENYINLFAQLIKFYNQNALDEKKIKVDNIMWSNNTEPIIGSSRINNQITSQEVGKIMVPTSETFQNELDNIFDLAQKQNKEYIDLTSGKLHRIVGGYPGKNHRMPLCCHVMKKNMKTEDKILEQPPKGQGATLKIRYKLPR